MFYRELPFVAPDFNSENRFSVRSSQASSAPSSCFDSSEAMSDQSAFISGKFPDIFNELFDAC